MIGIVTNSFILHFSYNYGTWFKAFGFVGPRFRAYSWHKVPQVDFKIALAIVEGPYCCDLGCKLRHREPLVGGFGTSSMFAVSMLRVKVGLMMLPTMSR